MKLVFMGTPVFAVPTLAALLREHEVLAVLTQSDRPAGRGKKMQISPVKETALAAGVTVLQPETLLIKKGKASDNTASPSYTQEYTPQEVRARLASFGADIFVVAAYGIILPKAVLEMPPLGCVNVHASLLPKYRGASPIHAALLNGDTTTGITIMHMDAGIDTGDMILKKELAIAPDEYFPSLHDRMAALGAEAILEALAAMENGTAERVKQDDSQATHALMIQKSDGLIDWKANSAQIINKVRAFDPWPGAYTLYEESPLKLWRAKAGELLTHEAGAISGTVLSADKNGLKIRCADGAVLITELQGQNSKRMSAGDFLRGRVIKQGTVLG
jgi:methionyl-tRNA formyltransferase